MNKLNLTSILFNEEIGKSSKSNGRFNNDQGFLVNQSKSFRRLHTSISSVDRLLNSKRYNAKSCKLILDNLQDIHQMVKEEKGREIFLSMNGHLVLERLLLCRNRCFIKNSFKERLLGIISDRLARAAATIQSQQPIPTTQSQSSTLSVREIIDAIPSIEPEYSNNNNNNSNNNNNINNNSISDNFNNANSNSNQNNNSNISDSFNNNNSNHNNNNNNSDNNEEDYISKYLNSFEFDNINEYIENYELLVESRDKALVSLLLIMKECLESSFFSNWIVESKDLMSEIFNLIEDPGLGEYSMMFLNDYLTHSNSPIDLTKIKNFYRIASSKLNNTQFYLFIKIISACTFFTNDYGSSIQQTIINRDNRDHCNNIYTINQSIVLNIPGLIKKLVVLLEKSTYSNWVSPILRKSNEDEDDTDQFGSGEDFMNEQDNSSNNYGMMEMSSEEISMTLESLNIETEGDDPLKTLKSYTTAAFQSEILVVLFSLINGPRKCQMLSELAKLNFVGILTKIFKSINWSKPEFKDDLNPYYIRKVQIVRLFITYSDIDVVTSIGNHYANKEIHKIKGQLCNDPKCCYNRDSVIDFNLGELSITEQNNDDSNNSSSINNNQQQQQQQQQSNSDNSREVNNFNKLKENSFIMLAIDAFIKSRFFEKERSFTSYCIEAFLRVWPDESLQNYLVDIGLLEYLVKDILGSDPKFLQLNFDLIGEVLKRNRYSFKRLTQLIDNKSTQFLNIFMENVIDSNVALRYIAITLYLLRLENQSKKDDSNYVPYDFDNCIIYQYFEKTKLEMIVKFLDALTPETLHLENLCCLNSSLVILAIAKKENNLDSYIEYIKLKDQESNGELYKKIKQLLKIWVSFYDFNSKDKTKLEFFTREMKFTEIASIVKRLQNLYVK